MKVWITVPGKTIDASNGPMVVPDYPTYYEVRPKGGNADGTFEILVDDPNAKPK